MPGGFLILSGHFPGFEAQFRWVAGCVAWGLIELHAPPQRMPCIRDRAREPELDL